MTDKEETNRLLFNDLVWQSDDKIILPPKRITCWKRLGSDEKAKVHVKSVLYFDGDKWEKCTHEEFQAWLTASQRLSNPLYHAP